MEHAGALDGRLPSDNPLSEREMDVARLLATGASNAEIARDLIISPHTVKVHLRNIFEKLQVSSRTEATMMLVQHGWLEVQGSVRTDVAEPEVIAIPEPAPLDNLPGHVAAWQRVLLVASFVSLLLLLIVPAWQSRTRTSAPLLTDQGLRGGVASEVNLDARWSALAPLPVARSRHAVAQLGSLIYVIGGEAEGGRLLRNVDAYDLTTNRWRSVEPLREPTSNLAAASLGEHIYVAGGTTTSSESTPKASISNRLLRYSTVDDDWQDMGPLPVPLAGAALASDVDALYLVGGWDGAQMRDEVWRYLPGPSGTTTAAEWELVERLPSARAFLGAVVVANELFTAGGFDGQRELAAADALNLTDRTWRGLPSMGVARSGLALVHDGVAIVALGGGWLDTVTTHERYDPNLNVWSNFPSPISDSWRHLGAASVDGQLYLLGGWSGDYLDIHTQYQSTFRSMLPVITNP